MFLVDFWWVHTVSPLPSNFCWEKVNKCEHKTQFSVPSGWSGGESIEVRGRRRFLLYIAKKTLS
jgi:hypothetical protein